jgi:U3 small nucleolar RNA-associated protein 11
MALRNVIHRRNHKERSQPTHRSKFGLLEKHKDYVQRAKDHNVKKQRLHKLAQKASLRNPDEFNFGMIRGATNDLTKGGLHVTRRRGGDSEPLDNDLVAILKSQDLSYVRGMIRAEEKKMEEIRQTIRPQLAFMTSDWIEEKEGREDILISQGLLAADRPVGPGGNAIGMQGKKTIWVDSVEEARAYKPSKGKAKASSNSQKYSLDMSDDDFDSNEDEPFKQNSSKSAEKRIGFLISQLSARQTRLETLNDARSKLEVVRSLMTTKGTNVRKVQARSDAIKAAVVDGKVTAKGLIAQADDDGDEDEEESFGKKKTKKTTWKWGNERKR